MRHAIISYSRPGADDGYNPPEGDDPRDLVRTPEQLRSTSRHGWQNGAEAGASSK
jgi:hypothetical protein